MKHNQILKPERDYRHMKLTQLRQPLYCHMLFLLFWPVYWLRYPLIEWINSPERCHVVYSALDDLIPFCEAFILPYGIWLAVMLGVHLLLMVYDVETFRKYSKFLIITFSVSTLTYLLYPTCQNLRPEVFPRDNFLSRLVGLIYMADNSSNVCPSEHVIGSIAFWAAAVNSKVFATRGRKVGITLLAVLTSISTVFLKQHSVIDVLAALPVCAVAYWICYGRKKTRAEQVRKL